MVAAEMASPLEIQEGGRRAEAVRSEVPVGMIPAAQEALAALMGQEDLAAAAQEAALGTTVQQAEGEAEAEEGGPLQEAALHRVEVPEEVMTTGTTTGTKEQRGVGRRIRPC